MNRRWVDELGVYEGESSKLALVDVGDDQLVRWGQHGLRACEEFVKVLRCLAAHFGFERRLNLSVGQSVPVNPAEESLLLYISLALRSTTQTFRWMLGHQPFTDGHSFFSQGFGVGHIVLHDGLKKLILVLSIKWRLFENEKEQVSVYIKQAQKVFPV